jgi:hypothetical protein
MSRRFLPVLLAAFVGCTPAPSTVPPPKITQQVQQVVAPAVVANPAPAPKTNPFIYSWIPIDFRRAQVYDDSFHDRYLGKEVEISGFVSDPVVVPKTNEPPFQVVDEGGKDADHPVICYFSPQDIPMLQRLKNDSPINSVRHKI